MIINDYYYATQLRYNNSFNSKTRKKGNNPRKTFKFVLVFWLFRVSLSKLVKHLQIYVSKK